MGHEESNGKVPEQKVKFRYLEPDFERLWAAHVESYMDIVCYIVDKQTDDRVKLFLAINGVFPFPQAIPIGLALSVVIRSGMFRAFVYCCGLLGILERALNIDPNLALIDFIDKTKLPMTDYKDIIRLSAGRLVQKGIHMRSLIAMSPHLYLDASVGALINTPKELMDILEYSEEINVVATVKPKDEEDNNEQQNTGEEETL
ncbi:MAG: hypothetical protein KatS3mg087_1097 [Patescibacteria group bacterium]|nr:MAG: hypothetical protein KatS3mg087_1097 [Patescibacteria group bacterium]